MIGSDRPCRRATARRARPHYWAAVSQAATALGGLANFLILARVLGPTDYGPVAGALAVVFIVAPLAALGADKVVVRDVSQALSGASAALTTALVTVGVGGLVGVGVLIAVRPLLLPQVAPVTLGALAVAELLAGAAILCCAGLSWADGRPGAAASLTGGLSVAKIVAVVAFAHLGASDPQIWATLYAAAASAAALVGVLTTYWVVGRPVFQGHTPLERARNGLPYGLNVSATIAQNDADKIILVRSGYAEEAGLYSIAYRLVTMAWLPVLAVLQVNYPRFFAVGGTSGLAGTRRLAARLIRPLALYAVLAGVGLAVLSPLVPVLLGEEYRGSVVLVALLAPLVLLKVAGYVPSDALTGAGRQRARTAVVGVSLAVNLALNVLLLPHFGLPAALLSTLVAELLYVVLVNVALRRMSDRPDRPHLPGRRE